MAAWVTGAGIVSPLGNGVVATMNALRKGTSATTRVEEWASTEGLGSHVASLVSNFDASFIPRKPRRTMSKMSEMLCASTMEALENAGLSRDDLAGRRVMLLAGSTTPSTEAYEASFRSYFSTGSTAQQLSTSLFKLMNHSAALNLASFLQFRGPVISPAAACATGAQAILMGMQMIDADACDIAICGGADECHLGTAVSFDAARAASTNFNDDPPRASRPFDARRDGVVVSEGAAVVVLESERSASERAAPVLGEVLGGAHSCDGGNVAHSSVESMRENIRAALADAGVTAEEIGYVNAHATSTLIGDLGESHAISEAIGQGVAVSSLKGHLGHSFAPCGTLEAIATLDMLRTGELIPTLNLEEVDPKMAPLDYLRQASPARTHTALSNNFAMGGLNVSLVLRSGGTTR